MKEQQYNYSDSGSYSNLVSDFLALKHIAVVGISRKSGAANAIFEKFKSAGYQVTPIHPSLNEFGGERCFARVSDVPSPPDGVFIMTNPTVTLEVTCDCIKAGVKMIWMHNMSGTDPKWMKSASEKSGSVNHEAVALAEQAGIRVIAGGCPMQHIPPVDVFHRCARWINERTGSV
jgi:predicted CoA-binding protein